MLLFMMAVLVFTATVANVWDKQDNGHEDEQS